MEFETIAEGLEFPEGPVALADGSVLVVEIRRGTLTRCWGGGKKEIVANLGGGPNGAAIGPDGAVYVCNNGGFGWGGNEPMVIGGGYSGGRIERVNLSTGKFERVYEAAGEHKLRGPNDIVFDKQGGFWFTDLGKDMGRVHDKGGLYYAKPDGSHIVEIDHGNTGSNGVGLSPDEKVVYVAETRASRLWAYDITAPGQIQHRKGPFQGRVVTALPTPQFFDSLAVTASGRVCVATLFDGAITSIHPDGAWKQYPTPDRMTTNICFGGKDMQDAWLTFSRNGLLVKTRWPEPGLRLNFNV
jgi:gluconolactonase